MCFVFVDLRGEGSDCLYVYTPLHPLMDSMSLLAHTAVAMTAVELCKIGETRNLISFVIRNILKIHIERNPIRKHDFFSCFSYISLVCNHTLLLNPKNNIM